MSRGLLLLLAAGVLAAGAIVAFQLDGDDNDPGENSAFTREELRSNWRHADRFPIVLPVTLPSGADVGDEPGFTLINVTTDPAHRPERRVWVSYYIADALGEPGTSFRVFQGPRDLTTTKPCGSAKTQPYLRRTAGDAVLTICSWDLTKGSKAREYWQEVSLSSDLEAVEWLNG